MKKLCVIGDIASGKSYVASQFGYPVFNADKEVSNIYKKNYKCYLKLKKSFPSHISKFPIDKKEIAKIIFTNKKNIKKIGKIVHPFVQINLNKFFLKNSKKKAVILDIPLLLENKLNKKGFLIIFVGSKNKDILKRLKKRKNFNYKLHKIIKKNQHNLKFKRKRSNFIIKNDYNKLTVLKAVKTIKRKLNLND